MDKTNNTKYAAQQTAEIIHGSHSWVPTRTTDPDTQHEITQLRNQLAELRQRAGEDTGDTSTPAKTGPSASSPSTTPIQRALMNSTCPAPPTPTFDPSSLLVCPSTVNPWLTQHMPTTTTLAVRAFAKWLKELPLSEPKRKVLTDNIAKTETWCVSPAFGRFGNGGTSGSHDGHYSCPSGQNYDVLNLLRAMTAAISLTN
jgi:hypothetical protein